MVSDAAYGAGGRVCTCQAKAVEPADIRGLLSESGPARGDGRGDGRGGDGGGSGDGEGEADGGDGTLQTHWFQLASQVVATLSVRLKYRSRACPFDNTPCTLHFGCAFGPV